MDNFRRYRPVSGRGTKSTDGFIRTRSPSVASNDAHVKIRRGNAYQPERPQGQRLIGDFTAKDGFHQRRRVNQRQIHENLETQGDTASTKLPQISANRPELPKKKSKFRTHHRRDHTKKRRITRLRESLFFNPFKPKNWTKRRAFTQFCVLILLVGGFLGGKAWLNLRNILQGGGGAAALQENVDPSQLRGEGDGRVNILLLGRGGSGHEGADLTDTIVIASINPIQKEAALLSIPRDLYVRNSFGGYNKINEVFANAKTRALATSNTSSNSERNKRAEEAGFKAIEDVIQSKIGLPIHYHAIVDFEGFRKAIDTVGGVSVKVPASGVVYENMWLEGRNYTLNVQQGQQTFDGLRALAYSRSRKTSARGDFDRSERQRLLMVALKDKVFSLGTFGNPLKISQLMGDFGGHVRTNLGVEEVRRLYDIGNQIPSNKISSVDLVTAPNDLIIGGMMNGLSVQIPKAGIEDYSDVKHFVRNRLRDGFLADENASVAVYNGTMISGLAGLTATDLKSYGYKVTTVGDAPTKGVQKTIVVDLRNGEKKYTKRYLENRFGTTVVTTIPDSKITPGTADFVIILGQNEQSRLAN